MLPFCPFLNHVVVRLLSPWLCLCKPLKLAPPSIFVFIGSDLPWVLLGPPTIDCYPLVSNPHSETDRQPRTLVICIHFSQLQKQPIASRVWLGIEKQCLRT